MTAPAFYRHVHLSVGPSPATRGGARRQFEVWDRVSITSGDVPAGFLGSESRVDGLEG